MRLDISDEDVNWNELARHIIDNYGDQIGDMSTDLAIKIWVIHAIDEKLRRQKEALAADRARRRAQRL